MSKKKTNKEFVNEIKESYPYIDVLGKYNGVKGEILIKDNRCGHEYLSNPTRIYRKSKCPCCMVYHKTLLEKHIIFKNRVYSMYGNEYSVIGKYETAKTPIKIKHNKCGKTFEMRPDNFLNGRQCPLHRYDRVSESNSFTESIVKEKIYNLVGKEYSLISNYKNAKEKVTFEHNICNTKFEITTDDFFHGQRCPKCTKESLKFKIRKSPIDFKKEFDYLSNNEYELLSEYSTSDTKVKIKHKKCGNIYFVTPNCFLNGTRCPKCKSSKGESKIREFLNLWNINYEDQKSFDKLVGINNCKLSYDFYLPNNNLLIEYQGEQHKYPVEYFGGEKQFKIQLEHDRRKREYSKEHNINLLEIWYYDFDNIESILKKKLEEITVVA